MIMTDIDNNKVKVSLNTLYDPINKKAFHDIVYNANELNHNHIAARVDFVLSELSNYLKAYSGYDKTRAIEDFFRTFGQQLTFDSEPYNGVDQTPKQIVSSNVATPVVANGDNATAPVVANIDNATAPVVANVDNANEFKTWLLNLINKRLAYDGKTHINIDRSDTILNVTCPQTKGSGLGESFAFLTGILNGLRSLSDKFKITGDFADKAVVNNGSVIMVNNDKDIANIDYAPITLSDYVVFNYTNIETSGINKYPIPPSTIKVNGNSYFRTGIVYHVNSASTIGGPANHYTAFLGINANRYYIDDDKVYAIKGTIDKNNITVKLISPKPAVDDTTNADIAMDTAISDSLKMPLDYVKAVIEGGCLPELVFYKKSGPIPFAAPPTEPPKQPTNWHTNVIPLQNPGTNSCFINAVIQNILYDQTLYNELNGDIASIAKGGKTKRRKSKRSKSKRTRKI